MTDHPLDDELGYTGAPEPWSDPRAAAAAQRVSGLHGSARRRLERLTLWCARSECRLAVVYRLPEGQLLVPSGEKLAAADRHDDRPDDERDATWARSPAVFLDDVLAELQTGGDTIPTAYAVMCRCGEPLPVFVDLRKMVRLLWRWEPQARHVLASDPRLR